MKILAGLGNPGSQYTDTRHNAGFWVIDAVARHYGVSFESWNELLRAKTPHGWLVKPQSFMNVSGVPIRSLLDYYKIEYTDVLVVSDDVYLAPGVVRVRKSGGDGGHNGLKSVAQHLPEIPYQVRVGVGVYQQNPADRVMLQPLEEYVLRPLPAEEKKLVDLAIDRLVPDLVGWLATDEIALTTRHLSIKP